MARGESSQRYKTTKTRTCEICGVEKNAKGFASHVRACTQNAKDVEEQKEAERNLEEFGKRRAYLMALALLSLSESV